MAAILDAFPEAVVFALPGGLNCRPIGRAYLKGLLEAMAERDAPGGFHLALESSYCLYEGPVSQLALSRDGDTAVEVLWENNPLVLRYWRERCSVAPGVWPLHKVETGGSDYPSQPWQDELAELQQQLQTLRAVTKRYLWSYSGTPVWCAADPDLRKHYGIPAATFDEADKVIAQWLAIVEDPSAAVDPRVQRLRATPPASPRASSCSTAVRKARSIAPSPGVAAHRASRQSPSDGGQKSSKTVTPAASPTFSSRRFTPGKLASASTAISGRTPA